MGSNRRGGPGDSASLPTRRRKYDDGLELTETATACLQESRKSVDEQA